MHTILNPLNAGYSYAENFLVSDLSRSINVSLANNIQRIGANVFNGCNSLSHIVLPTSLTHIGNGAFEGCVNLTNINIPNNVTSIGANSFKDCSSLTSITIPASVTYIGDGAFAGCNNLNITVSETNPNYSAQGNILYNKEKTKIIGTGKIDPNITIPNTVMEIGDYAFAENDNLVKLEFEGIPVIGDFAINRERDTRKTPKITQKSLQMIV